VLLDIGAADADVGEDPRRRREQIVDLGFLGAGRGRIAAEGDVGGAHEHELGAEGEHERGPAIGRLAIDAVVGKRRP
jgi:hypothetical protein